jgi:hypothetical protein
MPHNFLLLLIIAFISNNQREALSAGTRHGSELLQMLICVCYRRRWFARAVLVFVEI